MDLMAMFPELHRLEIHSIELESSLLEAGNPEAEVMRMAHAAWPINLREHLHTLTMDVWYQGELIHPVSIHRVDLAIRVLTGAQLSALTSHSMPAVQY
jgi:hypothetical protein